MPNHHYHTIAPEGPFTSRFFDASGLHLHGAAVAPQVPWARLPLAKGGSLDGASSSRSRDLGYDHIIKALEQQGQQLAALQAAMGRLNTTFEVERALVVTNHSAGGIDSGGS